jgi:hypothetical protein
MGDLTSPCSMPGRAELERDISLCSWRIGAIAAAALVLPHHDHERTT